MSDGCLQEFSEVALFKVIQSRSQGHLKVVFSEIGLIHGKVAIMACLQSFDPLPGGLPVSKNSSSSLKEDCKDDRVRRQQESLTQSEGHNDAVEPAYPFSQKWWWVENQGTASHRTFICAGDRYEMVSLTLSHIVIDT